MVIISEGERVLNEIIYYSSDFYQCLQAIDKVGKFVDQDGELMQFEIDDYKFLVDGEHHTIDGYKFETID